MGCAVAFDLPRLVEMCDGSDGRTSHRAWARMLAGSSSIFFVKPHDVWRLVSAVTGRPMVTVGVLIVETTVTTAVTRHQSDRGEALLRGTDDDVI